MAELARGTVLDRPWGRSLSTLAMRGLTGQVNVHDHGKVYQIGFHGGIVVGAHSPLGSDAAVRVALTGGLISSTQVADIVRRQAANPGRDEIELIAELARLAPDQAMRLRRRVIAQRASRSFALDHGEFIVEDRITVPIIRGSELDIRSVVYLGARQFLSEGRLNGEIGQFGAWFQLRPEAVGDVPQFGFGEDEQPVLDALKHGANLTEIETPDIEQRMARAVIYSLVCCGLCHAEPVARAPSYRPPTRRQAPSVPPPHAAPAQHAPAQHVGPTQQAPVAQAPPPPPSADELDPPTERNPLGTSDGTPVSVSATPSARIRASARTPSTPVPTQGGTAGGSGPIRVRTPARTTGASAVVAPATAPAAAPAGAPVHRIHGQTRALHPAASPATPNTVPGARARSSSVPQRLRSATPTAAKLEVEQLIKTRLQVLESGADHFTLLGLPREAYGPQVQKAYFALARQLHPDRLASVGIVDEDRRAHRLFAEVNAAFAILSDDAKRDAYIDILNRGGEAAVRAEQQAAEKLAKKILDSEEAFRRGEIALRRDQIPVAIKELTRAVELNGDEPDYQAMLTWAKFCGAPDKMSVGATTRANLERVLNRSPNTTTARFYLGRVERMLGRDKEALRHFQAVLEAEPGHGEATSEVRVLEARLGGDKGGGLFGRLKR